jgi:acetolactate synthase-1/2/3 large subunit
VTANPGGAVATSEALKQIHQTMDAVSILRPVTKFSATVGASDQVNEVLANAFRAAESGRPGAAYVNLPRDVMTSPCAHEPLAEPAFARLGPADSAAIKEAARLINESSNPVVLLGMLASKPPNAAALQTFISKSNLPVVGTFQAAGAVGAILFDNFGGRVGQIANQPADRLLDSADLVITIGYDPVEYWPPLWNAKSQRKILHIDVLPTDLDNYYSPYVELTGDIAQTLQALTLQLQRTQKSALSKGILEMINAERRLLSEGAAARDDVPIHPLRLVHELQRFLGSDVTVCLDMGSFHLWIARHLIASDLVRFSSRTASRRWASLFPGASLPRSSDQRRRFSRSLAMAASSIPPWNSRRPYASKQTLFTWSGSMALMTW